MSYKDPEARRAYDAARYAANQASVRERRKARYYADPRAEFRQNASWKARNPLKSRALAFIRHANRRARLRGVDGTLRLVDALATLGPCAYCGDPMSDPRDRTWDHVRPFAHNGPNIVGNIVPCCAPCNRRKSFRRVTEPEADTIIARSRLLTILMWPTTGSITRNR